MNKNKYFQYIVIGIFVVFIIVGTIVFATYKGGDDKIPKISITMWGTLPRAPFDNFTKQYFDNYGLKHTVRYTEKSPASFERELIEALANGTGPDAVIIDPGFLTSQSNKLYTIPYTSFPALNFKNTFIQAGEIYLNNNGVIALPFMVDPLVMYWNRPIFNTAGVVRPPANWSDIYPLIPKMTTFNNTRNLEKSTVALGEFANVNHAKGIISALIMQAGGSVISPSSDGTFKSQLAVNSAVPALRFFTSFSDPTKLEYSWNRARPNSLDLFANGDLAIYFGLASEYRTIKNKSPFLDFDVAVLPQASEATIHNTFANISGMAIMRRTRNLAGTYTVLQALTSASAVPFMISNFNIPSARRDSLGLVNNSAVRTIFNRSAIISKGWPDPNKTESDKIFREMVESYVTTKGNINQVIETASNRLNNLLKI